jgi:hypothetical protein
VDLKKWAKEEEQYCFLGNGREIREQNDLMAHIVGFYKLLFGPNVTCNMKLGENFWVRRPRLSMRN